MKQPDVDKFTGADPKDKLVAGLKASFKFLRDRAGSGPGRAAERQHRLLRRA